MTQPDLFPSYWTTGAKTLDEHRKLYRNIPVPARDLRDNKHIDDKTRLELMVDYLSTRDDFHASPIAVPGFSRLSLTEQMAEVERYIQDVNNAPLNQKESANKSLVNQLWSVGKNIYNKIDELADFADPVLDPLVEGVWRAAEQGGQEIGGQFLYQVQKYTPGEQTLERNYKAAKAKDESPWWRKWTGTSAESWISPTVRNKGWGVPAGVHIPLEVAFDPWNLAFGVGLFPDIFRGAKYGGKWVGKHWIDTDLGTKGRITPKDESAARLAAREMRDEARSAVQMAAELNLDQREILRDIYMFGQSGKYTSMLKEQGIWPPRRSPKGHKPGDPMPGKQERPLTSALKKARDMAIQSMKGNKAVKWNEVEMQDILNPSELREVPERDVLKQVIGEDEVYHPLERALLNADLVTGLRPNELENVKIGDLVDSLVISFLGSA